MEELVLKQSEALKRQRELIEVLKKTLALKDEQIERLRSLVTEGAELRSEQMALCLKLKENNELLHKMVKEQKEVIDKQDELIKLLKGEE